MAFEGLSDKLDSAFKKLRSKGSLNESDVKEAMREVRLALLEADVSYKVAKDFTARVTEKAIGAKVMESLTPAQMETLMNKKSGFLGISGISSDCRDLENAAAEGNHRAQLALDMFAYQIKKIAGGYAAAMGGVDAIIFTGGIGENSSVQRGAICSDMEYLGLSIGEELNNNASRKEAKFSTGDSKVEAWVIPTNEELMIAQDTVEIVFGK